MIDPFASLMETLGQTSNSVCGMKVHAQGRNWIVLSQVTPTLFMAVASGDAPPCVVHLIRSNKKDFIK